MKAKKKPLEQINLTDLAEPVQSQWQSVSLTEPLPRQAGEMVPDAQAFLAALAAKGMAI